MGSASITDPKPYVLAFPDQDYIGSLITRRGRAYEPYVLDAVRGLQHRGVIVDVGANIGNHTINWAVGGAEVVAYEPNPEALRWLTENIEANHLGDRIRLRPVAVGATGGHAAITGAPAGNLGGVSVGADEGGDLEMVSLDGESLDRVAVLKIDVEGGETGVLEGAEQLLVHQRPIVMMEAFNREARRYLATKGYRRFPIPLAEATHLYAPGWRGLLGLWTTPAVIGSSVRSGLAHVRGTVRARYRRLRRRIGRAG